MAHFPDLSPCYYFDGPWNNEAKWSGHLRSVGWLERRHEYSKGAVPRLVFRQLFQLARDPWEPLHCMGWHECDLCDETPPGDRRGPKITRVVLRWPPLGWLSVGIHNLFVPADGFLYVAPSMILHYISEHRYAPPSGFAQLCSPARPVGANGTAS